jgi:hypothetical protein
MSDNINFSGSVERFLKGDADPINIFGFNPTRAELRANEANRGRRASQIAFEQSSESLRKAGGSTDEATKQVKKLKNKTGNLSLSPFNPFAFSPTITVINAGIAEGEKSRQSGKKSSRLRAENKRHADTALTTKNLSKSEKDETRFSERRLRRSILGGSRHT